MYSFHLIMDFSVWILLDAIYIDKTCAESGITRTSNMTLKTIKTLIKMPFNIL